MSQPDRPEKTARPRWCSWHNGLADSALLIRIHEQGSGTGGGMQYACQSCRIKHHLVPLAERVT